MENDKNYSLRHLENPETCADEHKMIQPECLALQKKINSILNNVKEVIFQTDTAGLWTYLNKPWEEITGFTIKESLGQLFLNYVHPDDRELNQQRFLPLIERKKDYCRHEIRYITKDGGFKWIEVFARLTLDENDNVIGTSGTLNDVTERIEMENELRKHKEHLEELVIERTKKIEYFATHDALTDTLNRYSLEKELEKSIKMTIEKNITSALIFIDLDNFKVANDTFGHSAGDKILIQLAQLSNKYSNRNGCFARLGGDEFAILLNDINIEKAKLIAEQVRRELESYNFILDNDMTFNVTASIGIAKIDKNSTPQDILTYADTALYAAKDAGKNRIVVIESYDEKTKLSQANIMVNMIKDAVKNDKFVLYFQPIYKIGNGIIHYEALIRMINDDKKLIAPIEFIPIAEKFGLASMIDKWVVKNTIKILEQNQDIKIFINLSGNSLGDKALLEYIEEIIKNSNIEPAHLGFEITETTAIKDLKQSENWILKLKELGCQFALDDFGVGFTSFSYLNQLPIDFLKIDGSFVKNLINEPKQKALIQAMNAVAHALGKQTIAEFVEDAETLEVLKSLHVDYGQGYYLGKPNPKIEKK